MRARTPLVGGVVGLFVTVAVLHLGAQLTGAGEVADATQVLLMPLLAAALWSNTEAPRSRLITLTLVALGLSWLGDSAPKLAEGDTAFLIMIGFFLLAQVAYVMAFWPFRGRSVLNVGRPLLLGYVAVVVALVVPATAWVCPSVRRPVVVSRMPSRMPLVWLVVAAAS